MNDEDIDIRFRGDPNAKYLGGTLKVPHAACVPVETRGASEEVGSSSDNEGEKYSIPFFRETFGQIGITRARDVRPGDWFQHHYPKRGREPAGQLSGTVKAVTVLGKGPDLLIDIGCVKTSRHPEEGVTARRKATIGSLVCWGGRRKCLIVDVHGYPISTVDLRWTVAGTPGAPGEVSGHKRRVPLSELSVWNAEMEGAT